jgi:hypothetical protein
MPVEAQIGHNLPAYVKVGFDTFLDRRLARNVQLTLIMYFLMDRNQQSYIAALTRCYWFYRKKNKQNASPVTAFALNLPY